MTTAEVSIRPSRVTPTEMLKVPLGLLGPSGGICSDLGRGGVTGCTESAGSTWQAGLELEAALCAEAPLDVDAARARSRGRRRGPGARKLEAAGAARVPGVTSRQRFIVVSRTESWWFRQLAALSSRGRPGVAVAI